MSAKDRSIFHILVVDDDRAGARLLQEVMEDLPRRHELHFALDGDEALDFLYRRGTHWDAPRPNLILLDVNLARLGGLETLSAMKREPELRMIPVIMLSTSNSPHDVWRSYQAHANGYVRKPTDLDGTEKFARALQSFWMEFVLLPEPGAHTPEIAPLKDFKSDGLAPQASISAARHTGRSIARERVEARSRAIENNESPAQTETSSRKSGCDENSRLMDDYGMAVRELIELHEQQFLAIVDGDSECHRFDILIHMAGEKKQLSKYAYLRHVEEHGCSNWNALNDART